MSEKHFTIAIDGPMGSGKSSVAKQVANKLNISHLDTGAMYRALAFLADQKKIDIKNQSIINEFINHNNVEVYFTKEGQRTFISGEDVTEKIRNQKIAMLASKISKWPEVRKKMVEAQQELAKKQSMILDGRDIGTKVLPFATIKIFLTAKPEERAMRRFKELKDKSITYNQVLKELKRRDYQDITRKINPLYPAEDAIIIHTDKLNQDEVVDKILDIVFEKMLGGNDVRS